MNERQVWRVVGVVGGCGMPGRAQPEGDDRGLEAGRARGAAFQPRVATYQLERRDRLVGRDRCRAGRPRRLLSARGAAEAWKTATGEYPEGLDEVRP